MPVATYRSSAILVAVAAIFWILFRSAHFLDMNTVPRSTSVAYVSGFFQHDRQPTGPDKGFRAHTLPGLGLLERSYDNELDDASESSQWQRFVEHIKHLNKAASPGFKYKVLFVGRHGEGVHNVKEREVGRAEWDRYWSKLEGDGKEFWLDARLTAKGRQQAALLANLWRDEAAAGKIPFPESFYTSPLARCLETVHLTFSEVMPSSRSFRPIATEAIRELHGVHTCDKRSSKSWIQAEFPDVVLPANFTENDEIWKADHRESVEERAPFIARFLDQMFEQDDSTFVSLTIHSGAIRALYLAIGHPDVWVADGAIVPIVIRRSRVAS